MACSKLTPPRVNCIFLIQSNLIILGNYSCKFTETHSLNSLRRKYQILPPDHVVLAAIDTYFRICHNHPCTFFDEVKFRHNYAYGVVPTFLLLTIVASVARLLIDPWFENDHAAAAKLIAQAAWQQILADVLPNDDAHCVEFVQATGLLSLLDFKSDNNQAGTLKLRIAITVAQRLQLNLDPDPSLPPVEQEERRHVFWTLYLMDRVSALVFDQPYLIGDDACSLRLPEDTVTFHTKQCNQMPRLNTALAHAIPVDGDYAKKMIAMSVLGSTVSFCHRSQLRLGQSSAEESGLYLGLVSQTDRLGELLQKDTSRRDSTSTLLARQSEQSGQPQVQSAFQHRYAKIAFHIAQILINHPFLLRRHPDLAELSHDPNLLHHKLSICQQHAVEVLELVDTAQQAGTFPHTQLFPGWVIFSVAIVHCLFMHSPDIATARKSKEYFQKAQMIIHDLSFVDGTSQTQRYSAMLEFLSRNAGFSSWLVDPSFPRFNHPSISTSYWRFMDFDWLCEQFCIGTNPLSPSMLPSISAPQKGKMAAATSVTASESLVSNTRYQLAQQNMHTNVQPLQESGSGYIAHSRPLQPTSTIPLQRFDLMEDLDSDGNDSTTGAADSRTGSQRMYPVFDSFQ